MVAVLFYGFRNALINTGRGATEHSRNNRLINKTGFIVMIVLIRIKVIYENSKTSSSQPILTASFHRG